MAEPRDAGCSVGSTAGGDPLADFIPRQVNGEQVRNAIDGAINPFTKRPFSTKYQGFLEARKKLPVYEKMDEFFQMLSANQILIVSGERGVGTTTQIPQFVAYFDLPHTQAKIVACTQPRRMDAMTAAKRVANEMDVQLGEHVGYSGEFEDLTEPGATFLQYMTDCLLLREAMDDPDLSRYSTIILDEVHERTVATDILMGFVKSLTKRRRDLKIIVMSTTVDACKFRRYFEKTSCKKVPIFNIPGRAHPVEVFYTQEREPDYVEAAIRTVLMIHRDEKPGDILLFLTGAKEVEAVCRRIRLEAYDFMNQDPSSVGPLTCIPLYPSLPSQLQQRTFDLPPSARTPDGLLGRKVFVSTNMAETSLMIDGIVYVVDPGLSKQKIFNPRIRVESLLASPISKASAQQRARLAGLTRPGKCFRLYTEADFVSELEEQTYPEILRSNLSYFVLVMVKLGVKDLVHFDYIDRPAPETLMRALELLNYLAALDDEGNLTPLGSLMAEFPLDPQLSKLLIVSPKFKCSNEILKIVSMLSVPNVWIRPSNQEREADDAKRHLTVPGSDHLTLLNVYNQYINNEQDKDWARRHYVSEDVLEQADKTRAQLQLVMQKFDIELVSHPDQRQLNINIRQALVCGFFMQIAHKEAHNKGVQHHYLTVKDNQVVSFHPSCGLQDKPEWVVFNEFILTTGPYIRTVTEVKGEWLVQHAPAYFDITSFPNGETKRALQRVVDKQKQRKGSTSEGMRNDGGG
ncbi:putative P-loop containing nucleoside triphosphate hydrolase protein [Lyophyllum shimeji]|uniref:RNA helicase n=1 Tax=Lyophyllum shimeji TaxID=47721 RepID=A0A9P3US98_LYOSH|nr:putative P-loop containing nucleoside triphosphate hydrolase protein [Lyophyllum shimeji]